jgi:hypothetical protein
MTLDEFGNDERETTETNKSDLKELIRQTGSKNEASGLGDIKEVSESRLRQESVRFVTDESITHSPILKYAVVAAVIIVIFLIGFLPAKILGNHTESDLKKELSDLNQQKASANETSLDCLNELSGCVQDINAISNPTSAAGLAPRDHHVELKRKKKEAAEEEASTVLKMILDDLDKAKSARGISKDQWKELKQRLSDYSRLEAETVQAIEEYKTARAGAVKKVLDPTDPKVMERNKKRASFLAKSSGR